MMYDELIKRLRNRRICIQQLGTLNDYPLLDEAADAIEELQKRVPKTPHGRLIDADALKDIFFCTEVDGVKTHVATVLVNAIIDDAPTIIEANSTQFNDSNALDALESEGENG